LGRADDRRLQAQSSDCDFLEELLFFFVLPELEDFFPDLLLRETCLERPTSALRMCV
jgi:hypothetical protein